MAVGSFFFFFSPNCPKQPITSFPSYELFYPFASAKVSDWGIVHHLTKVAHKKASLEKLLGWTMHPLIQDILSQIIDSSPFFPEKLCDFSCKKCNTVFPRIVSVETILF